MFYKSLLFTYLTPSASINEWGVSKKKDKKGIKGVYMSLEHEEKKELNEEETNLNIEDESDTSSEENEIPAEAESSETFENEEIEGVPNKKINFKKYIILGLSLVLVLAAGIVGFIQLDKYNKSYAMVFEGKKIEIGEYKLYMMFQGGNEEAKEQVLKNMLDILVIQKAAKDNGIVLTEAEEEEVSASLESLKEVIKTNGLDAPQVSDQRLKEIIAVDYYVTKLMEQLNKDFVIDEADFTKELEDYIANNKLDYIDVRLKYILTDTLEAAEKARGKVLAGGKIDDAIKEFSIDYDESAGVKALPLNAISLSQEVVDQILSLNVSEITEVITLEDLFVIFEVSEINIPSNEELAADFRMLYLEEQSNSSFESALNKWKAEAKYKINHRAIDAIK